MGDVFQSAVSPDGRWIYLQVGEDRTHRGGLYKYDLRTFKSTGYLAIGGGFGLVENGQTLVSGGDSIHIVDTESFTITEVRPPLVRGPRSLPDGTVIVGAGPRTPPVFSNQLAVYDIRSGAYDTITVGSSLMVLDAFPSPDGRRVFVFAEAGSAQLYQVDLPTRQSTLVATLRDGSGTIAFGSEILFVPNSESLDDPDLIGCGRGELQLLDTEDAFAVVGRIDTGSPLRGLALSPDRSLLYCARALNFCEVGGEIIIFDTRTRKLTQDTIELPHGLGQPTEVFVAPSVKGG